MGNPRYKNEFELTVHHDLLDRPLFWKTPKTIFVNSMSDLFHDDIPTDVIIHIFGTMNKANWHTYQILTKRPQRAAEMNDLLNWSDNIWLGVSIENTDVIYRADYLKQTNARVKFISAEPLLSSLKELDVSDIDWMIVGGESGHYSRNMDAEWVRELQRKCERQRVPFFFKQWGGLNKKKNGAELDGKTYREYPYILQK